MFAKLFEGGDTRREEDANFREEMISSPTEDAKFKASVSSTEMG